jgi:hypothetical protein
MKKMEHQVVMEYDEGFFKIGMPNAYTPGMLADEFWALTQNIWEMGPGLPIRGETDGTIIHGIITDWPTLHAFLSLHEEVVPPSENLRRERQRHTDPFSIESREAPTLLGMGTDATRSRNFLPRNEQAD